MCFLPRFNDIVGSQCIKRVSWRDSGWLCGFCAREVDRCCLANQLDFTWHTTQVLFLVASLGRLGKWHPTFCRDVCHLYLMFVQVFMERLEFSAISYSAASGWCHLTTAVPFICTKLEISTMSVCVNARDVNKTRLRLWPIPKGLRLRPWPNLQDQGQDLTSEAEARRCMDYISYVNGTGTYNFYWCCTSVMPKQWCSWLSQVFRPRPQSCITQNRHQTTPDHDRDQVGWKWASRHETRSRDLTSLVMHTDV